MVFGCYKCDCNVFLGKNSFKNGLYWSKVSLS